MNGKVGILTLATPKDYRKAIGLAHSLRNSGNLYPVSVVCSESLGEKLTPYFDDIIPERQDIKGFAHKLYLDEYSPYDKTLFLDADMLVFGDLRKIFQRLAGSHYTARGWYVDSGKSSFGLDRKYVLDKLHKENLVCIDGAGHAYFEKPKCNEVFGVARDVVSHYDEYFSGNILADEDVMGIAMTICETAPFVNEGFLGSPWHAVKGTFFIDSISSQCRYVDKKFGNVSPVVVHFMRRVFPFVYANELNKLNRVYGEFDLSLYFEALRDWFIVQVVWRLKKFLVGR